MYKWTVSEIGTSWAESVRDNDVDYVVAVDGRKGSGKTTFAAWLAFSTMLYPDHAPGPMNEYFLKLIREKFVYTAEMDEQIDKVRDLYLTLPRYDSFVIDEAKEFHRNTWQKTGNIYLSKLLGECRKIVDSNGKNVGNKTVIFCQDSFFDYTKALRDAFHVWFRIMDKGKAAFFIKDPTPSYDSFHIDVFEKEKIKTLRKHWKLTMFLDINTQIRLYSRMPTFAGIVSFPPMPAQAQQEYLRLDGLAKQAKLYSAKKENEKMGRRETKYAKGFSVLADRMIAEGMNNHQIQKLTGIDSETIFALRERFKKPSEVPAKA